jgi:dienelactone hydrolase
MEERRIATTRTARYYTLGSGPVQEVWVVCHGYGQLARYFLRHFEAVAAPGRLIVAPEALSRFYMDDADGGGTYRRVGASWMTRDAREDEIADYTRWLDTAYADALSRGPHPPPRAAGRAGVLPGDRHRLPLARRQPDAPAPPLRPPRALGRHPPGRPRPRSAHRAWLSGRLTLVVGDRDPFATPERMATLEARLRDHGIAYAVERYEGGHRLDASTLRRIAEES